MLTARAKNIIICIMCNDTIKMYPELNFDNQDRYVCKNCLKKLRRNGKDYVESYVYDDVNKNEVNQVKRAYASTKAPSQPSWSKHKVTYCSEDFCRICGRMLMDHHNSFCRSCFEMYNLSPGKDSYEKFKLLVRSAGINDENKKQAYKVRSKKKVNIIHTCPHAADRMYLHNIDYREPLNVMLLCSHCHSCLHDMLKKDHDYLLPKKRERLVAIKIELKNKDLEEAEQALLKKEYQSLLDDLGIQSSR